MPLAVKSVCRVQVTIVCVLSETLMNVCEQDFDAQDFLDRPLFAHLATLGDAGHCETPLWFLWEHEALWMIGSSRSGFPKRLRTDERASVGIVDFDLERGLLQHLGMRGIARVLPMEADRRKRLVSRYLGDEDSWNPWFRENVVEHQDLLVKFLPGSVVARDQSYFRHGDHYTKVARGQPATERVIPMLDHISFGVSDVARSASFYDAALGSIGYVRVWTTRDAAGYARSGTDEPFAIRKAPEKVAVPDQRFHVAFAAHDRGAVRAFYEAAISQAARDDGPPCLCAENGERYHAAFVRDPDGYRVEAVCHE